MARRRQVARMVWASCTNSSRTVLAWTFRVIHASRAEQTAAADLPGGSSSTPRAISSMFARLAARMGSALCMKFRRVRANGGSPRSTPSKINQMARLPTAEWSSTRPGIFMGRPTMQAQTTLGRYTSSRTTARLGPRAFSTASRVAWTEPARSAVLSQTRRGISTVQPARAERLRVVAA